MPVEELAVNARAPLIDAPIDTAIALCSLSTGTTRPLLNGNLATYSTISVCGVIG